MLLPIYQKYPALETEIEINISKDKGYKDKW
jgi:hypothetical protein